MVIIALRQIGFLVFGAALIYLFGGKETFDVFYMTFSLQGKLYPAC